MNYFLDIVGSFFLGGFVILMIIQLNTNISISSAELQSSQISQSNASEVIKVLEFDLYKIGHKKFGEKVNIADSTTIKYFTDVDNDNVMDSIRYFLGNTSDLTFTTNPNDMPLYRKRNNNQPEIIGTVTSLNFSYLDETGAQLNYGTLLNTSERMRIRAIRTLLEIEANEPYESVYQGVDILRIIRPKNLNN